MSDGIQLKVSSMTVSSGRIEFTFDKSNEALPVIIANMMHVNMRRADSNKPPLALRFDEDGLTLFIGDATHCRIAR